MLFMLCTLMNHSVMAHAYLKIQVDGFLIQKSNFKSHLELFAVSITGELL